MIVSAGKSSPGNQVSDDDDLPQARAVVCIIPGKINGGGGGGIRIFFVFLLYQ